MKLVIEEIVRSHPAKKQTTFRREYVGEFEAGTLAVLPDPGDAMWLGHTTTRRKVKILAVRTMTKLTQNDGDNYVIVVLLDVASEEVWNFLTNEDTTAHLESAYVEWATEHKVWP